MGLGRFFKKKKAESAAPLPTSYEALLDAGFHAASTLQTAHNGGWNMDKASQFDLDLGARIITWTFADGKQASAPAELLGTWNPDDETFLWGWDHPSAVPGTAISSAAVRDHAQEHGIAELTVPKIQCDFETCYKIVSSAVLIGKLQGIYRFDAGGPWVYVGFGNVTLSQGKAP